MNFSFNTLSSQFQNYTSQLFNGMNEVIEVIKSFDLDAIEDEQTEESQAASSVNASDKLSERKTQFPFPVVYQSFAHESRDFNALKEQVEDYNKKYPEKLKIAFAEECVQDKGYPVWIGYSAAEFDVLCSMPDCQFLLYYFFHYRGSIFQQPDYQSRFYHVFVEEISLNTLRNQYETMPKALASSIQIDLPLFDNFSGSVSEIKQILCALLEGNEGILVGGIPAESISKQLLQGQMQNLAGKGVKILFLEHCCYDTLQIELDQFFQTKEASSFLEFFLKKECGCLDEGFNYYDIVKSAINAGIRPIGLERSATQCFGCSIDDGDSRADRMLGLNVGATEIIQKHKEDGKYVVLVGLDHLSYRDDIAGLSELCNIPSMYVESNASVLKSSYQQTVKNLDLADEKCGNKIHDHFVHCKVILKTHGTEKEASEGHVNFKEMSDEDDRISVDGFELV